MPKLHVYIERGIGTDNHSMIEIEALQPYQPDVLADMVRHAVTAMGALFPEDDEADLLEDLEKSYRSG